MTNAFIKYMEETYSHNDLAEICNHGCESGCASSMIYYTETTELFDLYRDDLFEIMAKNASDMGYDGLPEYVLKHSDTFATFANAVVWFCAEVVAYEITYGEFIDEREAE